MIVGSLFEGDSERIALIQYDAYDDSLLTLIMQAQIEYRRAETLLGVETELGNGFNNLTETDHRTLQWLHDSIAGQFRLQYCLKGGLFEVNCESPEDPRQINELWRQFLNKELSRLFLKWPELPRLIGMASCYPNPDPRGTTAEDRIYAITLSEYPDLKWSSTVS